MAYYKKYKKSYKKSAYQKRYYNDDDNLNDSYAYYDIDMHKDEIKRKIDYDDLGNIRYVVINQNLKINEVNAPDYKNGVKIFLKDLTQKTKALTVNNKEQYASDFAVSINPALAREMGWNCDIVEVEELCIL